MSSPLTKSDLCWVLVKLIGASFLYAGFAIIFSAALNWQSIKQDFELASAARKASMLVPIKLAIAGSLLPLAVGTYLMKSGGLLYHCLMSVPTFQPMVTKDQSPAKKRRELAPGIVLDDHEIEAFHTWLDQHPEFQNRPLVDQIALFRDAWGKGPKS